MKIQLELTHKSAKVKNVLLKADTVIGRSTDCGLRIASNEISRQHCKICLSDEGVTVRDLGSSNGTFVNGYQLEADTDYEIAPDSELALGSIKFIVRFIEPVARAMEADGFGSTVDLKPENESEETADFGERAESEETIRENEGRPGKEKSPAQEPAGEAEPVKEKQIAQADAPPESEEIEESLEMSTHGDSAILQTGEEALASRLESEPAVEDVEETIEDVADAFEEPETRERKVVVDLDLDEAEVEFAEAEEPEVEVAPDDAEAAVEEEPVLEADVEDRPEVEVEEAETAEAEQAEEQEKPPVAKPVEPPSETEAEAETEQAPVSETQEPDAPAFPEPAQAEMSDDDVAAFLNQVSEDDAAGDDEDDESLGDFFKQFG